MNKAIKKFWGVGLIVIMLASMIVMPASVSADDNAWVTYPGPSTVTYVVAAGSNVADIATQGAGANVYVVTGAGSGDWALTPNAAGDTANNQYVYKSTNSGASWAKTSANSSALGFAPTMVAVAPDDASRIAVSDGTGTNLKVSVNGGTTWSQIGPVVIAGTTNGLGTAANTVYDLTISPTRLGANYVTVCGTDNVSGNGAVFYYNLGAVVGQAWAEKNPPASTVVTAVAYSPNFLSDLTFTALTASTTAENVTLQVRNFNQSAATDIWNPADYTGYPMTVVHSAAGIATVKGSMALDPAYLGGESTLMNVFVGLDTDDDTIDGIYRVTSSSRNIYGAGIYSVAYDGTTLVAGSTTSTAVLRSLDPMGSSPTVTGTSSLKSPGGSVAGLTSTVVAFVGTNVAAGCTGFNSAFALSRSSGAAFNDVSMVDLGTTTVSGDIASSADGAKMYLFTTDNTYGSLWLKTTAWERVTSFADTADFIVRLAPANPDAIYVGAVGGTKVFFSKDVQSRFFQRTCSTTVKDMAVESDDVAYVLNATGGVAKSTNDGFIWSAVPVSTKLTDGYSIVSVATNVLFVGGGAAGKVAYSTDGGTTWTALVYNPTGANIMVIPDAAYATNSIIYAIGNTAGGYLQTWTIGSTATAWTNVGVTTIDAAQTASGLAMVSGNIYLVSANTTASTLYQYIPSVRAWSNVTVAAQLSASASPNGLETTTATGAIKLWALKAATNTIYQVVDTIGVAGPVITGPADKTSVTASNGVSNVVILTWNRVANATTSTVQVAFDTAFTQTLTTYTVNFPTLNQVVARDALVAGTTFYWRVRASLPLNSPYSEVRSLTVQALPASVPAISSPTNGASILSQSPAFSWTPVTGTTKYDFQLSTTPTFGTTVLTDQPASSGTLVPVTIKLDQGKQYFWRVRALEPVVGDWSAVANFIVALPATTTAPVVITQVPAPVITIPAAPSVPAITLAPAPVNQIAPSYIWAIIIIGGILVIAVIVLIVRTRRSV
jgi:hypothetical protein